MKKLQYTGAVKDGKLLLSAPALLKREVTVFEGKEVKVTIERKANTRSYLQNDYYWAVPVKYILDAYNDCGYDYNKEQVHEILKVYHNPLETIDPKTGEIKIIGNSTKLLSTLQFNDVYLERIYRWASETFGMYIPPPEKDKLKQQLLWEQRQEERKQLKQAA